MKIDREDLSASLLSGFFLLFVLGISIAAYRCWHPDGKAWALASQLNVGKNDVLVVPATLARSDGDWGRILFPLRPALAFVDTAAAVDLTSFPIAQFVLSPGATIPSGTATVGGAGAISLGDAERLFVSMVEYDGIAIENIDGRKEVCSGAHVSGGVACGRESWLYVGPRSAQLGHVGRWCLWAHPPDKNARVRIPFAVPTALAQEGAWIVVELNFLDDVRGDEAHEPVLIELHGPQGERSLNACNNRRGQCAVALELKPGDRQGHAIFVSTPNNGRQMVCLTGGVSTSAPDSGMTP